MANHHGPRRDLAKQRFWQACVGRWRRSGLSVREFCRRESVSEALFYAWRRELARREAIESPLARQPAPPRQAAFKPAAFVPVEVVGPQPMGPAAAIEILLPRGRRLRVRPGFDRDTLEAALEILERRSC